MPDAPDNRQMAQHNQPAEPGAAAAAAPYEVEVFYDGGCPLCRREIAMLRRQDRQQRIRFTDLDASDFDPSTVGKTRAELMARIHGRTADGQLIEGVEVFRRLYAAVGFRRLVWISRLPGVAQLLGLGYALFARGRLRLTGRCNAESCQIER